MKQVRELSGCRKRSKLSQEAVAEKLGVSRQTLSRWERGETEIPAQYLPKLAELYGVSINELLEEIYSVTDTASVAASTEIPEKPGEQTEVTLASTVQKPSRRYIIALCSMAAVIVLRKHATVKVLDVVVPVMAALYFFAPSAGKTAFSLQLAAATAPVTA